MRAGVPGFVAVYKLNELIPGSFRPVGQRRLLSLTGVFAGTIHLNFDLPTALRQYSFQGFLYNPIGNAKSARLDGAGGC